MATDNIDKRALINLDLYQNEIDVLREQLRNLKLKNLTKDQGEKLIALVHDLKHQEKKLKQFVNNYSITEISKHSAKTSSQPENFFLHLRSFENDFSITRDDVNEFLEKTNNA